MSDCCYGEFPVEVSGVVYLVGFAHEPYTPARLSGHPDTWAPAEGGCTELTNEVMADYDGPISSYTRPARIRWGLFLAALAVHLTAEEGEVYSPGEAEDWLQRTAQDWTDDSRNWSDYDGPDY